MRFGHKYGAKKTECALGHQHASKLEAKRCAVLVAMRDAGVISDLQHQPAFLFQVHGKPVKMANGQMAKITADFRYKENGVDVVEDVKGMIMQDFRLRWALAKATWPEIEWRLTR